MAELPAAIRLTQETLGTVVKKPLLTEKLLSRPPFRFLHDVISAVINNTGFMQGLYTEAELQADNIKDREGKMAFLQKAIDCVQFATGEPLATRPAKTVAGQEAERTNEFLQLLYKAIQSDNGASAVERVLNNEKPSPGGSADSNKENRVETSGTEAKERKPKDVEKKRERSTSKDRKSEKKEPKRGDSKSRKSTEDESKAGKEENKKARSSKDVKVSDGARKSDAKRTKAEDKSKASSSKSKTTTSEKKEKTREKSSERKPKTDKTNIPVKAEKPKESSRESTPKKSPKKETSGEPSPKKSPKPSPKEPDQTEAPAEPKPPTPPPAAPQPEPQPVPPRPTTAMRRGGGGADRPQSAIGQRPTTARPAPPRLRKGLADQQPAAQDEALAREGSASGEKPAPAIIQDTQEAETADNVDDFVVQETEQPFLVGPADGALDGGKIDDEPLDDENHGVLVETILKKKKEFEETFADDDADMRHVSAFDEKQRENARRDTRRMQDFVQLLTRTSHPLGRLLDFMQEDIDSMIKEIGQWQSEHKRNLLQLQQHRATAVSEVEATKVRLDKLDGQIVEQRKKIGVSRAATLEVFNQIAQMANSRAA